jgi:Mrp family chromosome partitioning ATPase
MRSIELVTLENPKSMVSEVYRTLRTNIKFTSFQKDIKTIVVTSPGPGEGKSTVASNLGITMAQAGSRVLIIDGDLRKPSLHKNSRSSIGMVLQIYLWTKLHIRTMYVKQILKILISCFAG